MMIFGVIIAWHINVPDIFYHVLSNNRSMDCLEHCQLNLLD